MQSIAKKPALPCGKKLANFVAERSCAAANLRDLRSFLPSRPPCLHQRRQFFSHRRTHRLPASRFLLGRCHFLGHSLTLLLCPPRPLCSRYFGPCRCTHGSTLTSACFHSRRHLGWTAPACRLGAKSRQSCNCLFDTAHFLSELCHYALNIHVRPFPEELSTQCSRQADACGCRKGTAFRRGGTSS